jgi:hypothetical protein
LRLGITKERRGRREKVWKKDEVEWLTVHRDIVCRPG